jgi:hypothetical protein
MDSVIQPDWIGLLGSFHAPLPGQVFETSE